MATSNVFIWSDLKPGKPQLVGGLLMQGRGQSWQGTFQYAPDYIDAGGAALDPVNLPLARGPKPITEFQGIPQVVADAGPDGWGKRVLLNLHPKEMQADEPDKELHLAKGAGIGAMRFSRSRLDAGERMELPSAAQLGAAAEAMASVEIGKRLREEVRMLIMPSGQIGGVNPKVLVRDDDGSWIVKFNKRDEVFDAPLLEAAVAPLAVECGVDMAHVRGGGVGDKSWIRIKRFDVRDDGTRRFYISAHALWSRRRVRPDEPGPWETYAGLARMIADHNAQPDAELLQLYRRMVFNVVIGNTDDHSRNHGLVSDGDGQWRLSPAFDVCPPLGTQMIDQMMGIGTVGRLRSIENLLSEAPAFRLDRAEAARIVDEIRGKVTDGYALMLDQARVSPADRAPALGRVLRR